MQLHIIFKYNTNCITFYSFIHHPYILCNIQYTYFICLKAIYAYIQYNCILFDTTHINYTQYIAFDACMHNISFQKRKFNPLKHHNSNTSILIHFKYLEPFTNKKGHKNLWKQTSDVYF